MPNCIFSMPHQRKSYYTNPSLWVPQEGNPLDVLCKHIAAQKRGTTRLLIAKNITHQSHIQLLKFLNRCSEFSDSGSSDPEAAVEKPACSVVVCCNEQTAGSRENSSVIEEGWHWQH